MPQGGGRGVSLAASVEAARPLHHPSGGPPPPLRFTARGRINEIVLATRSRPSLLQPPRCKVRRRPRGRRSAERRMPTICRARNKYAVCRPAACLGRGCAPCRGAPAFRRFDRGSRQGLPSLLNSRPCFLGLGIKRALPVLSCPSAVTAPHASAVVPKGMMPEAAPARIASPRGSTALAPHLQIASGMRPSMSEIFPM